MKEKKESKKIYNEELEQGKAVIMYLDPNDCMTEFKLGNIPENTEIEVSYNIHFISTCNNIMQLITKFPLNVCNPDGCEPCLTDIGDFPFKFSLQINQQQKKNVSCGNLGEYIAKDDFNGMFSFNAKPSSLIITTEFFEPIRSHCITSENYICANIVPKLPPNSETKKKIRLFN